MAKRIERRERTVRRWPVAQPRATVPLGHAAMIATRRACAVLTIALDRPATRNALDADGWDALARAIDRAATSDAAAVVLLSDAPGVFSAGADLAMIETLHHDEAARPAFRDRMARVTDGIAALPMPAIAAVDGPCFGAAVALVLACDIVVAGPAARFAVTPAKLGIGYPGGDVARLIARVGRGQAARLLFTADAIDADEALRIGLADLSAAEAGKVPTALAARIAANSAASVRLLKATMADPAGSAAGFDAAFGTRDFADRLAAFRARPR